MACFLSVSALLQPSVASLQPGCNRSPAPSPEPTTEESDDHDSHLARTGCRLRRRSSRGCAGIRGLSGREREDRLLAASARAATRDIWTMDPDGGNLVNLTAKSKADDLAPNWRADGRRIAFMSFRVTATNPEGDSEIFVMDADGSHQTQITFNALDDENPAWSPDGTEDRLCQRLRPDPRSGRPRPLHDERRRHRPAQPHEHPGVQDSEPNWSPDGSEDRLRERPRRRPRGLHDEAQRLERPAAHVQRRVRVPSELVTGRRADHLHHRPGRRLRGLRHGRRRQRTRRT